MSLHRYAPKRDANEQAIVDALEAVGCTVTHLSGTGVPDLLVGRGGRMWLGEVKSRYGRDTPDQIAWAQEWNGPVPYILRSVDDALAMVGAGK